MLTVIVSNNIYRDVIVKKNTSSLLDNMLKLSLISNFFLCRLFSYGEFKAEDQQKMLDSLNSRVEEVYRSCIGDNEANIRLVHFL